MDLSRLLLPFKEDEIEWRIAQAGKKGNGQIWAMCLAYVQARAIMNRLDEVVGAENWQIHYEFISAAQAGTAGVVANLAIRHDNSWITKCDGAEQTDIESFKGGLSSALKRAGSVWGIGRYLYKLESAYATIVPKGTKDEKWAKTKDGTEFYWVAPALPAWALPAGEKVDQTKPSINGGIHPEQPPWDMGSHAGDEYRITFGKFAKRSLKEIPLEDLRDYYIWQEEQAAKKPGVPVRPDVADFMTRTSHYLASLENQPLEPGSNG